MNIDLILRLTCALLLVEGCLASNYQEETVYTQALITISYGLDQNEDFRGVGKYGKDSPKNQAQGFLLYYKNQDWCRKVEVKVEASKNWIALVPKTRNCSITTQILNVKRGNATAVIFYDERASTDIPMIAHPGARNIVTAMIRNTLGMKIIQQYEKDAGAKLQCKISVGTHYVDRRWKVSRTSVLFVLVSFILLMCISLAWLVFYYVQRFRYIYRNDRKEKQLLNAAKKAISKLKTKAFRSIENDEDAMCVVCLEAFKENETLRVLPCNHEFHKSCIDPWLLNHRTCPMCKANILKSLGVDIPENLTHSENELGNDAASHDISPNSIGETPIAMINLGNSQPQASVVREVQSSDDEQVTTTASPCLNKSTSGEQGGSTGISSRINLSNSTIALVSSSQRV